MKADSNSYLNIANWSKGIERKLLTMRKFRRIAFPLLLCTLVVFLIISYSLQDITHKLQYVVKYQKAVLGYEVTAFNQTKEVSPLDRDLTENPPTISHHDLITHIQNKVPSLPVIYLKKNVSDVYSTKNTCSKFPSLYDINFHNLYWQTVTTSNGTMYLYSAYYDNRTLVEKKPVIRIIGMINRLDPTVKTHCQVWFDGFKKSIIVPVFEYKYIWVSGWGNYENGLLQPYLLSCQIPAAYRHIVPVSVSVAEQPCGLATTNLRVINNLPKSRKKEGFAVCVKGLDFFHEDRSLRLIEWLELLFILGAHKVFLYVLNVHPNIAKVIKYYQALGKVNNTKLTLPGDKPNITGLLHMYLTAKIVTKRQNEVIPYNDCFYKNMYSYSYIILLDIDEIIIPKTFTTWRSLINNVTAQAMNTQRERPWTSYALRNVYFMDSMRQPYGWTPGIPKYMHMLQNVYRSKNYTRSGDYVKCFHDTERILTLHNHFPFACLDGECSAFDVSTEDAHLQHYRHDCVEDLQNTCEAFKNSTVRDTTIWKYQKVLLRNVRKTLFHLGYLKQSKQRSTSHE